LAPAERVIQQERQGVQNAHFYLMFISVSVQSPLPLPRGRGLGRGGRSPSPPTPLPPAGEGSERLCMSDALS
jgi:hypothetical protein